MTEITIEKYAGKMNRAGYDAFLQAMRHARGEGNRQVELVHWLFHALSNQNADIACSLREVGIDRGAAGNRGRLPAGPETKRPGRGRGVCKG